MSKTLLIKNRTNLETSELRRKALDIIEAGISRVLPGTIMRTALSFEPRTGRLRVNDDFHQVKGRLFVIGGGKASGLMAQALERIIGPETITAGIIVEKANPTEFSTRIVKMVQAGHPIPDSRGVAAVQDMLRLKQRFLITGEDIVLCLLSGGASALMPSPVGGVSLREKQEVTRLLLACGADIYEINTVRKHLSRIKGGRLAQYFAPARVISLILSDVVGNDLSVIASGPTCPDPSTYADACTVLQKYRLTGKAPEGVVSVLEQGCKGVIPETPKWLDNVNNYIIGYNRMALAAMAQKARDAGFNPLIISSEQTGDTEAVARRRAQEILAGTYEGYNALIIGGETTPALPPDPGKGGRNQHYAALTALLLAGYPGEWVMASVGTDGSDFIPEVAGAIVDQETRQTISNKKLDYKAMIARFDSNTLLAGTGNSLVITGSTGTNVGDIMVYLLQSAIREK